LEKKTTNCLLLKTVSYYYVIFSVIYYLALIIESEKIGLNKHKNRLQIFNCSVIPIIIIAFDNHQHYIGLGSNITYFNYGRLCIVFLWYLNKFLYGDNLYSIIYCINWF